MVDTAIDHLSKPPIKAGDDEPWRTLIRRAAENLRVYAKMSGLYPAAGDLAAWSAADVRPYLQVALDLFDELAPAERLAILGGTAASFHAIGADRLPGGAS